jgi:O-succinylbenzoate synthase
LELEIDGVRGLGEVSPQPHTMNGDAGIQEVIEELERFTLRHLQEITQREGSAPQWARATHLAGSRPASHPATALLEMALLDVDLRARRLRIDEHWPARFETPVQITVSLLDALPWAPVVLADQVRAKLSTAQVPTSQWQRLSELDLPVLLDFNCSGDSLEAVVHAVAEAQRHLKVVAVEQPFAPGNVVEHARLARLLDVPVSLDEGVRNRRDLEQIARYQAARSVCIKPARVGGFAQARTMIERARRLGLEVYLGGFFESPLARRANRTLARHEITRPSDIADSQFVDADIFAADPWGCGYLAGAALELTAPLVTHRW